MRQTYRHSSILAIRRYPESGLRGLEGKNFLYCGILKDHRKGRIGFHGRKFLVAFVLGLPQENQATLEVAGLSKRLCKEE